MLTEEKVSGSGLKPSTRKKRPYRSQLTVMYIVAVMACLVLGYIVGTRLLDGNEEQRDQTTMAGVDSSNGAGTGDDGSSQQEAGSVLPPLSPLVSDPDKTGAGMDDTVSDTAGSVAPEVATSAPRPVGQMPQISLPSVGTSATASGATSGASPAEGSASATGRVASQAQSVGSQTQSRPQPQTQPQAQPTLPAQPASKVESAVPASSSSVASTTSGQRAVTGSRPTAGSGASNQLFRVIVGQRDSLAEAKALEAQAKAAGLEVWIAGSGPYQVQVGAFKSRANAVAFAEQLQGEGFTEAAVVEPAS